MKACTQQPEVKTNK